MYIESDCTFGVVDTSHLQQVLTGKLGGSMYGLMKMNHDVRNDILNVTNKKDPNHKPKEKNSIGKLLPIPNSSFLSKKSNIQDDDNNDIITESVFRKHIDAQTSGGFSKINLSPQIFQSDFVWQNCLVLIFGIILGTVFTVVIQRKSKRSEYIQISE